MAHPWRRLLPALVSVLGVTAPLLADARPQDTEELERISVSAVPLHRDDGPVATPYSIIDDYDLETRRGATLGATLDGLPGVHADSFGAGASRPVIRGQTSPRVKVLSDSSTLMDASDVSPDHAITAEPMLVDRVEVLRGPATLLYGSGAIGGVVNLLDQRVPTRRPEGGVDGMLSLRGNTAARERAAAAGVTVQAAPRLLLRAEGAQREANDYEVHGFNRLHVPDSHAEGSHGSFGATWLMDNGYLGIAWSERRDEYGLPGHSHAAAGCHPHGATLHCSGGHHHHHGDEGPYVDLISRRWDLRGEWNRPLAGIERIRLRGSHTDYAHDEIEEGVVGTRYETEGFEGRLEVEHAPFAGWRGVVGLQSGRVDLGTYGLEAFLPLTRTDTLGLFVLEHYDFNDAWSLEGGYRFDYQKIHTMDDPQDLPHSRMYGQSFSSALTWSMTPEYELSLNLARSQRLPHAQELYANGIHLATNTWECGLFPDRYTCGGSASDRSIRKETSLNTSLNLRRIAGPIQFDVSVYYNRVSDYIYARTLDQQDSFRLIKYTHGDATFRGAEAEATWFFSDHYSVTVLGDVVRGELRDGGPLPRISPYRAGIRVNGWWHSLAGDLELIHTGSQNRLADFETRTPGYRMLNASLRYHPGGNDRYTLWVRGTNLLRERVWEHTSFLADLVPQPGRNVSAGVTLRF